MPDRIEPGHEDYNKMLQTWVTAGNPALFNYRSMQWLALKDNDILAFVKVGLEPGIRDAMSGSSFER